MNIATEITKKEFTDRVEFRNKNGDLHREDGPAVIYKNGHEHYYQLGVLFNPKGAKSIFKWSASEKTWSFKS